ncbi:MAG: hypothetical protein LWW95_10255 [Candidatus Desulfofervidus auxilii]|nr:hypothetical protein [Candidatus Desulfofervidus auxilii]
MLDNIARGCDSSAQKDLIIGYKNRRYCDRVGIWQEKGAIIGACAVVTKDVLQMR